MILPSNKRIKAFLGSDRKITKGLEKENLRSDISGKISSKSFPLSLGEFSCNEYVTLDYSEPHLELVSPTFENNVQLLSFLKNLHKFVENNIDGDLLWNYSMPPKFKQKFIKLPDFGVSNESKLSYLYRLGLRNRYGDKMQSTAGIHFNISFSDDIINRVAASKNEFYLGICRNFLRVFPIALRLTGCSPITHKSFVKGRNLQVEKLNDQDCYLPNATSLRVSRLGYYSDQQEEKFITFNSLKEYLQLINEYINVPNEKFREISTDFGNLQQINNGTIQMESELYNHIRPKGRQTSERQYLQLSKDGIEYLEIRSIDLNPYSEIGLSKHDIEFWELIIILCALSDSPEIEEDEVLIIKENIRRAAESGQNCNILKGFEDQRGEENISLVTEDLINDMKNLSTALGVTKEYQEMINEYLSRNKIPPSSKFLSDVNENKSLFKTVLDLSKPLNHKIEDDVNKQFLDEVASSNIKYNELSNQKDIAFEEFIMKYREEIK